jgi:hypothetical protein
MAPKTATSANSTNISSVTGLDTNAIAAAVAAADESAAMDDESATLPQTQLLLQPPQVLTTETQHQALTTESGSAIITTAEIRDNTNNQQQQQQQLQHQQEPSIRTDTVTDTDTTPTQSVHAPTSDIPAAGFDAFPEAQTVASSIALQQQQLSQQFANDNNNHSTTQTGGAVTQAGGDATAAVTKASFVNVPVPLESTAAALPPVVESTTVEAAAALPVAPTTSAAAAQQKQQQLPPKRKFSKTLNDTAAPVSAAPTVQQSVRDIIGLLQLYGPLTTGQIEYNLPAGNTTTARIPELLKLLVATGVVQQTTLEKYCVGGVVRADVVLPAEALALITTAQQEALASYERCALLRHSLSGGETPKAALTVLLHEYPDIQRDPVYAAAMRTCHVEPDAAKQKKKVAKKHVDKLKAASMVAVDASTTASTALALNTTNKPAPVVVVDTSKSAPASAVVDTSKSGPDVATAFNNTSKPVPRNVPTTDAAPLVDPSVVVETASAAPVVGTTASANLLAPTFIDPVLATNKITPSQQPLTEAHVVANVVSVLLEHAPGPDRGDQPVVN